jgi:CAI-1 autoinducer synthase
MEPAPISDAFASPPLPEVIRQRIDRFYNQRFEHIWHGKSLMLGRRLGKGDIALQSNDYLALAGHPSIAQAQSASLASQGQGMMMSAVFEQDLQTPMRQLENRLGRAMGAASGILTQSGYAANVGLLQSIAGPDSIVYLDMLAHMSLREGTKSAGARSVLFAHNDVSHLDRQIERHGPGIIAVDAVYSTLGDICPLDDIVKVARRRQCALLVDESHSLGVLGPHGAGLVASLGLNAQVHFMTASLAKAYCTRAGLIACPGEFNTYFSYESLPAIFSSALLPFELAGLQTVHVLVGGADDRRARLRAIARRLRNTLADAGYPIERNDHYIVALEIGSEEECMRIRDLLEDVGVFGSIFAAPATPTKHALIRLSLHADISQLQELRLGDAFRKIHSRMRTDNWTANRTARRAAR